MNDDFAPETVQRIFRECGLEVLHIQTYVEFFCKKCGKYFPEWDWGGGECWHLHSKRRPGKRYNQSVFTSDGTTLTQVYPQKQEG